MDAIESDNFSFGSLGTSDDRKYQRRRDIVRRLCGQWAAARDNDEIQ